MHTSHGGLAQLVERSLSRREAPGSNPGSSSFLILFKTIYIIFFKQVKNIKIHLKSIHLTIEFYFLNCSSNHIDLLLAYIFI